MSNYLTFRNRRARVNWYFRRAQYEVGHKFPDARTQEQRDQGMELHWRARMKWRELQRNAGLSAFLRPQALAD